MVKFVHRQDSRRRTSSESLGDVFGGLSSVEGSGVLLRRDEMQELRTMINSASSGSKSKAPRGERAFGVWTVDG